MERTEIEERNKKLKQTIDSSGWFIKSAFMMTLLKPDEEAHYVIFEEDSSYFEYEGENVHIEKGSMFHEDDKRVPWDTITGKYRHVTNEEFFKQIALGYISKTALILFSEKDTFYEDSFDKDNLINWMLIKTILESFDRNVYMELADFDALRYFIETDEDVIAFFKQPKELRENIVWNAINKIPVSIVLFYIVKKHQTELIQHWPFSTSELKELLRIMNISEDVL